MTIFSFGVCFILLGVAHLMNGAPESHTSPEPQSLSSFQYLPVPDLQSKTNSTHASSDVEDVFRRLSQIRCDGYRFQVRQSADEPCVSINQVSSCDQDDEVRHINSSTAVTTCQPVSSDQDTRSSHCLLIDDGPSVCQLEDSVHCQGREGLVKYAALGLSICECLTPLFYVPQQDQCYLLNTRGPCPQDQLLAVAEVTGNISCIVGEERGVPGLRGFPPLDTLCLPGSRSASRGLCL